MPIAVSIPNRSIKNVGKQPVEPKTARYCCGRAQKRDRRTISTVELQTRQHYLKELEARASQRALVSYH